MKKALIYALLIKSSFGMEKDLIDKDYHTLKREMYSYKEKTLNSDFLNEKVKGYMKSFDENCESKAIEIYSKLTQKDPEFLKIDLYEKIATFRKAGYDQAVSQVNNEVKDRIKLMKKIISSKKPEEEDESGSYETVSDSSSKSGEGLSNDTSSQIEKAINCISRHFDRDSLRLESYILLANLSGFSSDFYNKLIEETPSRRRIDLINSFTNKDCEIGRLYILMSKQKGKFLKITQDLLLEYLEIPSDVVKEYQQKEETEKLKFFEDIVGKRLEEQDEIKMKALSKYNTFSSFN